MKLKWLIWTHLVAFAIGAILAGSWVHSTLPETIAIKKHGEPDEFAYMNTEDSRILNVSGGNNPGAYLAFPIYKPHDALEKELS